MGELNEDALELDQASIEDAKNSDANVNMYDEECECVTDTEVYAYEPAKKKGAIDKLKEDYPWLYRALRTFFQTFVSVACTEIAALGVDELTKKTVFAIVTAAIAAAIAAVMNIPPKEKEE